MAIIPTGSELVPAAELDKEPESGRLPEFNSVILSGLVAEAGGEATVFPIVPDDPALLIAALKKALAAADLVLINAGSSAGTEDYTYQAVAALGEVLVHGVAMMPGKPTLLGLVAGKPVIGNPGYPVSAVLSFEQFAAPLIAGMAGKRLEPRPSLTVHPAQNLPSKPGLTEFIRVTLGRVGDKVIATPLPRGAGTITSLVRADGLLTVPSLSEGLEEDRPVAAELLVAPEEIEGTLVVLGSHDNTLDLLATLLRRRDPRLRLSSGPRGQPGGPDGPAPGPGPPGGQPPAGPGDQHLQRALHSALSGRRAPETHQPDLAAAGPDAGPGQPQRVFAPSKTWPAPGCASSTGSGAPAPACCWIFFCRRRILRPGPSRATTGRNTPTWPWR